MTANRPLPDQWTLRLSPAPLAAAGMVAKVLPHVRCPATAKGSGIAIHRYPYREGAGSRCLFIVMAAAILVTYLPLSDHSVLSSPNQRVIRTIDLLKSNPLPEKPICLLISGIARCP